MNEVVTYVEREIEPLATEWDGLADRVGAPPFARPGWFAAWWRAFGVGELELLVLRRGGRLAAVLPLERRYGVVRGLANYHSPAFAVAAEDEQCERELVSHALTRISRRLSLAFLDPSGRIEGVLSHAASGRGHRTLRRSLLETPIVEVQGGWESALERLNTRFRKEIRRYRRRLNELGEVELEIVSGGSATGEQLREAFAVEGSGWKLEGGTAIVSRPETRQFYEEIAAWAGSRGLLRLFLLRLDGKAIAVDFALEDRGIRYLLKGGFDHRYKPVAPGILLLEDGLRDAFEAGLRRVELGGGADAYKLRWTDTVSSRVLVQAFPRTALGVLDWGGFAIARPVAKRVVGRLSRARLRE